MVVDSKRAPIASVLVTAVDPVKKETFKTYTDDGGEFALQGLSASVLYLVTVHKPGFIALETRTTLRPVDTLDLDVILVADPVVASASPSAHPLLRGTVVDSMRAPLAAALVTAVDSATDRAVFETHTDSAGRFTLDSLSAGVPYLIAVRRVGSRVETSRATLRPGDTLNLKFVLVPVALLAPVRVKAKTDLEFHDINADELAKANLPLLDAYDVVMKLRPLMLGNPYKGCMQDSSTFTFGPPRDYPGADLRKKMQDPRKFTLGVGEWGLGIFKNGGTQIYKKDKNSGDKDGVPTVDSAYPFHLYINGALRDIPGARNILSQIPVDDVQEMRYIDCLDATTPQYRNSLMITLKPGKIY